jgi:hypothetical protein
MRESDVYAAALDAALSIGLVRYRAEALAGDTVRRLFQVEGYMFGADDPPTYMNTAALYPVSEHEE